MADIAPSIFGAALVAEQLVPVLAAACETSPIDKSQEETSPFARSVRVLSMLLRELAETFDKPDSTLPRGMKQCVRQVLEGCNDVCDELRGLFCGPDGGTREAQVRSQGLGKAKMDQLQTAVDLQKAMLTATIALAAFTREVMYSSNTHDSSNTRVERLETKRAEVDESLARAIKWDRMRLMQDNMQGLVDSSDVSHSGPEPAEPALAQARRPSNPAKVASFAPMRRFPSPSPSEANADIDQSVVTEDRAYGNFPPSPCSFQANKALRSLVIYWEQLQSQCDSAPQEHETLREHEERAKSRDEPLQNSTVQVPQNTRQIDATRTDGESPQDLATHTKSEHQQEWTAGVDPKPRPEDLSRSSVIPQTVATHEAEVNSPPPVQDPVQDPSAKHNDYQALQKWIQGTRTPSPSEHRDETYMPPSPPYSTASVVNEDHNVHNVVHHHVHHVHHHEHHTTAHNDHTEAVVPPSTNMPPNTVLPARSTTSNKTSEKAHHNSNGSHLGNESWNVLQVKGGVHWEVRKKRGDKLVIRQYLGQAIAHQGETEWSHLALSGSVWSSLPRRYCTRTVLLNLSYDFKEDEEDFHVLEELEYDQVEKIIRLSLKELQC